MNWVSLDLLRMFNSVMVELISELYYYYYYIFSQMAKKWCAIRLTFPSSKTKQNNILLNVECHYNSIYIVEFGWCLCWRYCFRFYQWTFSVAFRHIEHHYYVTLWVMLFCYTFKQNITSHWQHFPTNLSCTHLKIYSESIHTLITRSMFTKMKPEIYQLPVASC